MNPVQKVTQRKVSHRSQVRCAANASHFLFVTKVLISRISEWAMQRPWIRSWSGWSTCCPENFQFWLIQRNRGQAGFLHIATLTRICWRTLPWSLARAFVMLGVKLNCFSSAQIASNISNSESSCAFLCGNYIFNFFWHWLSTPPQYDATRSTSLINWHILRKSTRCGTGNLSIPLASRGADVQIPGDFCRVKN